MRLAILVIVAGCGRIAFDPLADGATTDGTTVDAPAAPVLVYPMDSDPSTGTIPASVSGFDGSCTGCPTSTAGHIGNAYAFDGVVNVQLPAAASVLLGTQPYTVTLWLNPTTTAQTHINVAIAKPFSATSDADVINVWINNNPAGELRYQTTQTGAYGNLPYIATPAGQDLRGSWHHVAASWDGSVKRLYVDGALIAQQADTLVDSTELVLVGADKDSGSVGLQYTGAIDDLRIYDRPLADADIAALASM